MKLLIASLLLIIIIIVCNFIYASIKTQNITRDSKLGNLRYMYLKSERTIPRIRYDKDGGVNPLPVVNNLPLNYIPNPVLR